MSGDRVLEAWSDAVGGELTDLAGLRFTRLTANADQYATVFHVESTFGWPAAGKFLLDGVIYTYTGKTNLTLTGVAWPDVGLAKKGTMAAALDTVTLPAVNSAQVRFAVTGPWAGLLAFEGSTDGVVWSPLSLTPESGPAVTGTASNGVFTGPTTNLVYARVKATSWGSGEARVTLTVYAGVGAKRDHRVAAHVLDMSRTFSAVDAVRGQFFVATAEGEALSTLARNLGVTRPPDLLDDAAFRRVIQALAYLPKGTVYGLELALTAFFGAGNFEIIENFPSYRNTVFIRLLNGISLANTAQGQTYMASRERVALGVPGAGQVTVTGQVLHVQGIRLADEDRFDRFTTDLPSLVFDPADLGGSVWSFGGSPFDEVADVTMSADLGATMTNPAGHVTYYWRPARVLPESRARLTVTVRPNTLVSGTEYRQYVVGIRDGARDIMAGMVDGGGGQAVVAFIDATTGNPVVGAATRIIPASETADITVRKDGDVAELVVNGQVVDRQDVAAFATTSDSQFLWGIFDGANLVTTDTLAAAFWAETLTDFWNDRGGAADVNSGSPTTLDTNAGSLVAGDVGKTVVTTSALPLFPPGSGGQNNGAWTVATWIDSDQVVLTGVRQHMAMVESGFPGRIRCTGNANAFHYPEDVGKKLQLFGTGPNAVTVTIVSILDAAGAAITGTIRQTAPMVQVSGAPVEWVTEGALDWMLLPNFTTEAGLSWEIVGVGTAAPPVLTMRAPPSIGIPFWWPVVMEVTYTSVANAQLLADPVLPGADWFPAYLPQHPFGPYAIFLDNLTVAGVIPEILVD